MMMNNNEDTNGEFEQTNMTSNETTNTPEDLQTNTKSEMNLPEFDMMMDLNCGFKIGDVIWYYQDPKYVIKRSKIADMIFDKQLTLRLDKLILENGDELSVSDAFHTKKEVLEHMIDRVTANINNQKITLANAQHRLCELERTLKILQMHHATNAAEKDTPEAKKWTCSDVYGHLAEILDHPEQYVMKVTSFSRGGLGGGYSTDVSAATLARCWEHPEYRLPCPCCNNEAFISRFASRVNSGGYWELKCYCPTCGKEHNLGERLAARHDWPTLNRIANESRLLSKKR